MKLRSFCLCRVIRRCSVYSFVYIYRYLSKVVVRLKGILATPMIVIIITRHCIIKKQKKVGKENKIIKINIKWRASDLICAKSERGSGPF